MFKLKQRSSIKSYVYEHRNMFAHAYCVNRNSKIDKQLNNEKKYIRYVYVRRLIQDNAWYYDILNGHCGQGNGKQG